MTRTTKNINIRENNNGFAIYNNGQVVMTVGGIATAKAQAIALAKVENKGVVVATDYYTERLSAKKVATL